jgi:very-short-patch-repair endonuclease
MIQNRPTALLTDPTYRTLPKLPYALDWTSIPELIRVATLDLGGIQPVTKEMMAAAGGTLHDKPSEAEVELFRKRGTTFQLISVVLSVVAAGEVDGVLQIRPFAVTLIPASKRGEVDQRTIDLVAALDLSKLLEAEPIYSGYDPFSGEWSVFGNLPGYLDGKREGFLDEIGLVLDQFFLATETGDDEILTVDLRMPSDQMMARYVKHRKKLFFTPFQKVEARRVWGAETPIELFVIQALAKENLFPQSQILIMNDGATFPSLYHLWQDFEFRQSEELVAEVDLYFPTERVAVFCDGGRHARGKKKVKDAAINAKLEELGIKPIRIPGREIKLDLDKAVSRVKEALGASQPESPASGQPVQAEWFARMCNCLRRFKGGAKSRERGRS